MDCENLNPGFSRRSRDHAGTQRVVSKAVGNVKNNGPELLDTV